jgi:hypothetical protein
MARCTIVCDRVEMVRTLICPPSFLADGPQSGVPFPPPGPSGSVPRLHQYYGTLRFPAARSAALRCLRLAVPLLTLVTSLPSTAERHRRRPGVSLPGDPSFRSSAEAAGPPRFLGNPTVCMPCSLTPVGPPRQAISALRCCLPLFSPRRLPRSPLFEVVHPLYGGSITRPAHSLSTLRHCGHP